MQIQRCGNNVRNDGTVGRAREEAQLARALIRNKIFPTWIFHGISGIGKAHVAVKFAKHLLADVIPMEESLGGGLNDITHSLVDSHTHPDFFMQEQTSEPATIEDARALFLRVRKTPALSKRRVVIWENASDLNKSIYNSLLKILEEPPAHTVIILICNGIGTIPQTLLSRAAKIYFPPLEESAIKLILDDMNVKNSERLAQLADGSAGYAWQLHANNGIEVYDNILNAFSSGGDIYPKTLKCIIDNNL
jgi:DNA polymerase-3 subunit delta'